MRITRTRNAVIARTARQGSRPLSAFGAIDNVVRSRAEHCPACGERCSTVARAPQCTPGRATYEYGLRRRSPLARW